MRALLIAYFVTVILIGWWPWNGLLIWLGAWCCRRYDLLNASSLSKASFASSRLPGSASK